MSRSFRSLESTKNELNKNGDIYNYYANGLSVSAENTKPVKIYCGTQLIDSTGKNLNQVLELLNMKHELMRGWKQGLHKIINKSNNEILFEGRCHQVWEWLKEQNFIK